MDLASKEFLRLYSLLLESRDYKKEYRKKILRSNDPVKMFYYALKMIKGRWPEAEEFIKKHRYAYYYAKDIIGGRWPEAEEYIKKNPWDAYRYAKDIIKGRWPEAEELIKKNPEYACEYAKEVIKGRWPEAEDIIKKNNYFWNLYLKFICKECNGDGIVGTGIGGAEEECSRCNGGGFDPSKI